MVFVLDVCKIYFPPVFGLFLYFCFETKQNPFICVSYPVKAEVGDRKSLFCLVWRLEVVGWGGVRSIGL